MVKKFLKIAGVKNEQEFYNKYPTEAAFFKAHPEAKGMQILKQGGQQKKLKQLTGYQGDIDGVIPTAQVGTNLLGLNTGTALGANPTGGFDWSSGISGGGITGAAQPAPTLPGGNAQGMYQVSDFDRQGIQNDIMSTMNKKQGYDLMGKLGGAQGIGELAGGVIGGIQHDKGFKKQKEAALRALGVAKKVGEATTSRSKDIPRYYGLRPEDLAIATAEGTPKGSYQGTNTSVLGSAEDGAVIQAQYGINQIGGNPTEIQNMYNPGDIYSDMGYEPLNDSDKVKQYRHGGMKKAQFGEILGQAGNMLGGGDTQGTVGAIGNIAGKFIPGLGPIAQFAQGAINREKQKAISKVNTQTQGILNTAAFSSGLQGVQGQYGSYMENGGQVDNSDYQWMSHTWQPQVITKFGEHNVSDLLRHDDTMDTLRTGGRVTQNNMFPTDQYAFGGELQTTWGGYAEPISHNPYLPGSGQTVMFRGKSHEESDGKGRTGIGVKYGNGGDYSPYMEYGRDGIEAKTDVEVERGEPATELADPQTGETNMVVFGNLKIPNMFLNEIGDKNAKNKKFKNYANDLSKKEAKQNKILDKFTNQDLENYTPFDTLAMNSANAMHLGAHMNLKDIADKKNKAAMVQNAINETAEEHGIDADALARGKVMTAKYGKKIEKAQSGKKYSKIATKPGYIDYNPLGTTGDEMFKSKSAYETQWKPKVESVFSDRANAEQIVKSIESYTGQDAADVVNKIKNAPTMEKKIEIAKAMASDYKPGPYHSLVNNIINPSKTTESDQEIPLVDISFPEEQKDTPVEQKTTPTLPGEQKKKKTDWLQGLNTLLPYLNQGYNEEFDSSQLYPEMFALAANTLEPVKAQGLQPLLETPYDISLQDQMNEITASSNAARRMAGGDPSALANIAAQESMMKNKVQAEQFRMNQANLAGVYGRNRQTLMDTQAKNLGIFADQEQKQQMAKSKTKATAQEALSSMSDKIAKQKLENRTMRVYENMYPNYRFNANMRATPTGLTLFQSPTVAGATASTDADLIPIYDSTGKNVQSYRQKAKEKETARNGLIVKSLKRI